MQRPCSLREADKGIFQGYLPNRQKISSSLLPIEYRFFFTCPICWCIHPRAMHYIRVYMPILCIIQEYPTQWSRHSFCETWYIRQCFIFGASCFSSCQSPVNIPLLFLLYRMFLQILFICKYVLTHYNTLQT